MLLWLPLLPFHQALLVIHLHLSLLQCVELLLYIFCPSTQPSLFPFHPPNPRPAPTPSPWGP